MGTSIFLAKLIGPYCIIVAVGILLNRKTYDKVLGDFCKNLALVYISGGLALSLGLIVVLFHNVWTADWRVIITLLGWIGILDGAWLVILPNTIEKITGAYQKNSALFFAHLLLSIVLGVILSIAGYCRCSV